jgi:hypothetical protein
LVGFEPTTVGTEVTRAFTTPQTFLKIFHYVLASCLLRTSTPVVSPQKLATSYQVSNINNCREELAFTGSGDSNPRLCSPTGRSNRELHHPGRLIP